jgi:hypothetical protein
MKTRIALAAGIAALLLAGCAARGPVAVDPDRDFGGLRDLVKALPEHGTLDVVLVHGMGRDGVQTYNALIRQLRQRLDLSEQAAADPVRLLVNGMPDIALGGRRIFSGHVVWKDLQPRVTTERYQTVHGHKFVAFHRFEYWQLLGYIKCRYLVMPDSLVEGPSHATEICAGLPYAQQSHHNLSSSPASLNRDIKTGLVEWGLGDAVIATSDVRFVLRQALREALAPVADSLWADVATKSRERPSSLFQALRSTASDSPHRVAFVTHSLGSYVVFDAARANAVELAASPPGAVMDAEAVRQSAPLVALCGASQIHMMANQLALLRLFELNIDGAEPSSAAGPAAFGHATSVRSLCNRDPQAESLQDTDIVARKIVAYHEPSDLLSFYASDTPGAVGADNRETTNVVVPFAHQWLPGTLANPSNAHSGQTDVPRLMDLIACGRHDGRTIDCTR